MADNIDVTPGTGKTIAADEIGGVLHQRVKLSLGADGVANDASAGAGAVGTGTQRVTLASDDPAVTALASVATAAKQPALGAAGTASADVITVQGIASAVAIPVTYATATRTSRSGTITTGGAAQQLMAANSSRKGWFLQNNNTTGNIWFDETGSTAVATQPSIKLYPGDYYESPPGGSTPTAISIIGDTTGMTFSAREW